VTPVIGQGGDPIIHPGLCPERVRVV
jgi:hypothetical protein